MAPVDAVESLLAAREHVVRAELGCAVEELWEQGGGFRDRVPEGVSGVVLRVLRDGGAASQADLSEDHVITEIDGEKVGLRDEVLAILLRSEPGRPLRLSGFDLAEGADFEITVELGRVRLPWESQ